MFANKDCFEIYDKTQEVRKMFNQFKQKVIIQLGKLESQIETIIYELFQKNITDKIDNNSSDDDLTQLNDVEMQQLFSNWNKECQQTNDQHVPQFNDQLVLRIQKTFQLWESQIQDLLQMDLAIIPKYSIQQYVFDHKEKFPSLKVNDEVFIEQTQTQTHYCFALVVQRLNKTETSSIQFKFPKFVGDIGVGICDKQILRSKDFRPLLSQINNGAFVCFQDTYMINTEQEEFNWKTKGFKFCENDIIEVTYEPSLKMLTWKKVQNPKEVYSIILQNDKRELHFCCVLKTQGAVVGIIKI